MEKYQFVLSYRIFLCLTGWISILISLLLNLETVQQGLDASTMLGNWISYYTIQSNFIVAIWLTLAILYHKKDQKPVFLHSVVQGAITTYITVTFLGFAVLLSAFYQPIGWWAVTNITMHYAIPIAFILDWFLTGMDSQYEWKYSLYWLAYPLGYLIYTLIRGAITRFYPYYFIDANVLSILELIVYIIALSFFFFIMGVLYIFINRRIHKNKNINN